MNLPNKLTISRMILSPIFMVFFIIDNLYAQYMALLLFSAAALTDLYDGYLAKKTGITTNFGKFMDPLADKILTATALVAFVAAGYIKAWMVLLIIARDFIVTGLRMIAAYKGLIIMPSRLAKWKTATQMVAIVMILLFVNLRVSLIHWQVGWSPMLDVQAYQLFNGIILIITVLAVISGLDYLIRNRSLILDILK